MSRRAQLLVAALLAVAAQAAAAIQQGARPADVVLDAGGGLTWRLVPSATNASLWAVGQPLLAGSAVDSLVDDGIAFWRRASDYLVVPVLADALTVDPGGGGATLTGSAALPEGAAPGGGPADTSVALRIVLDASFAAASLTASFSSASGVAPGWQLCLKWAHDGDATNGGWRVTSYPRAANSSNVASTTRLDYAGWPGMWLLRDDVVAFFSLSTLDDYANPTGGSWTGATTFAAQTSPSRDGARGASSLHQVAPQFMLGGSGVAPGQVCEATTRLLMQRPSAPGDTLSAVRAIVPALLRIDAYAVQAMPPLRPAADLLACFVNARRGTPMWRSTPAGNAYQVLSASADVTRRDALRPALGGSSG